MVLLLFHYFRAQEELSCLRSHTRSCTHCCLCGPILYTYMCCVCESIILGDEKLAKVTFSLTTYSCMQAIFSPFRQSQLFLPDRFFHDFPHFLSKYKSVANFPTFILNHILKFFDFRNTNLVVETFTIYCVHL